MPNWHSPRMDRNPTNEFSRVAFSALMALLEQQTSNSSATSRMFRRTGFTCGRGGAIRSPPEGTP